MKIQDRTGPATVRQLRCSRGTLEVKKEDRWKRYQWEWFRRDSYWEAGDSWLVVVAKRPRRRSRLAAILAACALWALPTTRPL
jgi:hypothetical protein